MAYYFWLCELGSSAQGLRTAQLVGVASGGCAAARHQRRCAVGNSSCYSPSALPELWETRTQLAGALSAQVLCTRTPYTHSWVTHAPNVGTHARTCTHPHRTHPHAACTHAPKECTHAATGQSQHAHMPCLPAMHMQVTGSMTKKCSMLIRLHRARRVPRERIRLARVCARVRTRTRTTTYRHSLVPADLESTQGG